MELTKSLRKNLVNMTCDDFEIAIEKSNNKKTKNNTVNFSKDSKSTTKDIKNIFNTQEDKQIIDTQEIVKPAWFWISLYNNTIINKEGADLSTIYNNGTVNGLAYLSFSRINIDWLNLKREISTNDFLSLNREAIESDCKEYQKYLYLLFYKQSYNCYDYLKNEYLKNNKKLKIDILENRLTKTIERITNLYIENKMQDILLFSKQQIDIVCNDRELRARMTRVEATIEKQKYFVDTWKSTLDKLDNYYICKYIIEKIGISNYNYLINYYNQEENSTEQQKQKTKYIKKQLQAVKTLVY